MFISCLDSLIMQGNGKKKKELQICFPVQPQLLARQQKGLF